MKILFVFLTISLAIACQSPKQEIVNSARTPTTAPPIAANAEKSKIRLFNGSGKITKINSELGSVELDHGEIKGLMPPMIMEFYVSDKKMLDKLKLGDTVDFVLEDNAGAERIVSLNKK